jgi:hypothetical protein
MKLTIYLHIVPRSRMVELYLHSHIGLHGVGLNSLSRGTALPLPEDNIPDKIEKHSIVTKGL